MRDIFEIAFEVRKVWVKKDGTPNIWFGAVPYLDAMDELRTMDDMYGLDTAVSVVLYFLANAAQFRGADARRLKDELRAQLPVRYRK